MKDQFLILVITLTSVVAKAQSTAGITGIRDTSYNLTNEYNKHLKNYPFIKMVSEDKTASVVSKKDIPFCKTAQRELKLDVFYPKQKAIGRRTAIIFIHGGGWRSGNKTLHHPMAKRFAQLGYVCITPEYRLSTEALYPAAIFDIKAAIRWVRKNAKQLNIDTNKIVLSGHSAGGELAAFMGATNGMALFEGDVCNKEFSSRANAVIDIDGTLAFIHPESGEGDDSKRISAATHWFGYSKTENPGIWKQAAPLTHVGPQMPPTMFINSSVERMHAGRKDFINVLDQFSIYNEVKTFEGSPHSFVLFNPWFDSTVNGIHKFIKKVFTTKWFKTPEDKMFKAQTIIVAQDGTGDFTKVQQALNAVAYNNKKRIIIRVKPGVYKEKLFLDSTKNNVQLLGDNKFTTILTYNDHTGKISPSGDTINTRTSWSFKIRADQFLASNITFQNDAGFNAGQAVAVESNGDKATFINCRFIGNQDVLFLNSEKSRQHFQSCYIEGTTDFIFGAAAAWFQKCKIYSKKNSHITAASTPQSNEMGFVFDSCTLRGDTSLHNVSLGRPWRPYAHVVYMNCYIGSHIKPEGWSNWNNTENHKTTRYAEYKNYGPSSDPTKRVSWSKQLSEEEAKKYSLKQFKQSWYSRR